MQGTACFLELFALETIEEASDLKLAYCSAILLLPYNPWEPVALVTNTKENLIRLAITLHEADLSWRYFSPGEIFERIVLIGSGERSDRTKKLKTQPVMKAISCPDKMMLYASFCSAMATSSNGCFHNFCSYTGNKHISQKSTSFVVNTYFNFSPKHLFIVKA